MLDGNEWTQSVLCASVVACESLCQCKDFHFLSVSQSFPQGMSCVLALSSILTSPVSLSLFIYHTSSAPIKSGPHLEHEANILCSCGECVCVRNRGTGRQREVNLSLKCQQFVSALHQCHQMTLKMVWKGKTKEEESGGNTPKKDLNLLLCAPHVKYSVLIKSNLIVSDAH